MDPILSVFLSWQFIMFSLGIYVITWMMRTLLEYRFPKVITSKFYSEIVLPFTPVLVGAVVAFFATQYAYPAGISFLSGRLVFGATTGMFSGLIFRVIKSMLKSKLDPDDNFVPAPPAPPNAPPTGVMGTGIR
jgi:hypothetical protein